MPQKCFILRLLFLMVVHTFDPWRDRRQQLIGYCIGSLCVALQQVILTEYNHPVALMAVYIRNIDEAHIHTDGTNYRSFLAVDQNMSPTVTQATIQAVGIAYGYNGDT